MTASAAHGRALLSDGADAQALYELALERHTRSAHRAERARTQLAFGEFLRRSRRRVDARTHLRAALQAFDDLGAAPWAERAHQELRASGETARKRDPSTATSLTPQELQVARLVRQGLSNRDAAAQLFLSPRQARGRSPSGRAGHLGVIVAGSVGTGLVAALLLDLVIFAGADEHVITGAAMLAFALGWAMLAIQSTRRTDLPQRWAFVPAAAMGIVGLALLLIAPGNGALTTASWVWPPVTLALAAWMGLQLRRAVKGRSRWLLYPVVALLAVAAVGGMYESAALAHDQRTYAMPGRSYDVGGYRLHLNCTGSGRPTVVLQGGLGETSPWWSRITPAVVRTTRVCSYDRAGQGWSDDAPRPQDGLQVAKDLHTLLGRAGEHGPYVLVGHSTGGTYAMTYAARYPGEVAGMVLLDSASPDQFTVLPGYAGFYSIFSRVSALLPGLGRLGVGQILSSSVGSTLPEPAASQARAFATSPQGLRSQRDELSTYHEVFRQAQALTTLDGKPLAVLTATVGQQAGWATAQDRLATLSSNSSHRLAHVTHAALLDERRGSEISVRAIDDVVQSVRTGSPVVTQ